MQVCLIQRFTNNEDINNSFYLLFRTNVRSLYIKTNYRKDKMDPSIIFSCRLPKLSRKEMRLFKNNVVILGDATSSGSKIKGEKDKIIRAMQQCSRELMDIEICSSDEETTYDSEEIDQVYTTIALFRKFRQETTKISYYIIFKPSTQEIIDFLDYMDLYFVSGHVLIIANYHMNRLFDEDEKREFRNNVIKETGYDGPLTNFPENNENILVNAFYKISSDWLSKNKKQKI